MMQTRHRFKEMSAEKQNMMMQRFNEFQQRGGKMMPNHSQKSMSEMSAMMEQKLNNTNQQKIQGM
jgi:hypothetical protein